MLERKLAQFPAGTVFTLQPSSPTPSARELEVRKKILQFAEKTGITVM
jgi:hypothetical protein